MLKTIVCGTVAVAFGTLLALSGCTTNDSNNSRADSSPLIRADGMPTVSPDGKSQVTVDAALPTSDAKAPECFQNPKNHNEIINACTTAQFVDKVPFYPAKAPNGVLPQLP